MIAERDRELGAALRALDVPEHAGGFEARLEQRLRAERRPALVRRRSLRWGAPMLAAAAAAAVVAVAIGIPETSQTPRIAGPETASAAVVQARVRQAFASIESLSGTLVADGPGAGDRRRWSFALTAAGDFLLRGPHEGELIAYDAAAGVVRSAQRSSSAGGDTLFYAERRGVAPGPPDEGPPTWILPSEYGAYVRALLASDDPRVVEIAYDGRPAWRLDVPLEPNELVPQSSGDELRVIVDRATGFPVRVVERRRGATVHELRIGGLLVDRPPARDAFRPAFPAGAEVSATDDGFRRLPLTGVAAAAGYRPLAPAWRPAGYELAEAAVGPEGVVSLSYRRGLDQFLVTTRRASAVDPLRPPPGVRAVPQRVALRGALAGGEADLVLAPQSVPHIWGTTGGLGITVGGDLSRVELIRVAESLERL
jgi:hypothetical protein